MFNLLIEYAGLLIVILLLVMLANKLKIAYPIILVLGGLLVSFVPGIPVFNINPELIFVLILPPLLYEAAWYTSWKEFWKWRRVISIFASLIVIVTASVVALVSVRLIPGFTLALGFLLGGIVSPPDAVSASAILKNVKVPKRIVSILEGESLLNDAASLIIFRFALMAITTGTFVFQEATAQFFIVIIMGIVTGIVIGIIFYAIYVWFPTTPNIDIMLTFITPYAMYIVAEKFHFSGVLAVVSGGLFLSIRSHRILKYQSRLHGQHVWSAVAFALNGFVFLLIGLELPVIITDLGEEGLKFAIRCGLLISLVLILLRVACTFSASVFTHFISRYITTADSNPGWKAPLIIGWAGMRGVVSLAAALSIPMHLSDGSVFPYRNLILFITFSVILVTLVLQGLTLPALVRWINLDDPDYPKSRREQEVILRKKMSAAALEILNNDYSAQIENNPWLKNLEQRYKNDVHMLSKFHNEGRELAADSYTNYRRISLELLKAQRQVLMQLNKKEQLDEDVIRKHVTLLDLEEEKVRRQFVEED
jgi:Na+/H+ antiporter